MFLFVCLRGVEVVLSLIRKELEQMQDGTVISIFFFHRQLSDILPKQLMYIVYSK